MNFRYTHDEMSEAVEILFDNLDTSTWEDSYHNTVIGHNEPNQLYKETVEHKVEYLNDVLGYMLDLLEHE